MTPLAAFEEITGASGVAPRIEAMLLIGVRHRQLRVRTLLAGMMLSQADYGPAYLTRVRDALIALPEPGQVRLGVLEDGKDGPHLLTYRQTERTFGLVAGALGDDHPGGLPAARLQRICDDLLEASIPEQFKDAGRSLAVDWTDLESFSRPPPATGGPCADPEASWGHRKNNLLRSEDELFYGYYLSAGIMMRDENGPAVPEFARRATASSCRHDPVRALVPVLTAMPAAGIPLGDVLAELRLRPPRRRWLGDPAPPGRGATHPGPPPPRPQTAAPKAPTKAPSSATATSTARAHPAPCWNSARCHAAPPASRPPRTTRRPPSSPATNSAASPATTLTATTASSAPQPWASSAAPCARSP